MHRTKVAVAVVLLFALVAGLCSMLEYITAALILTICAGGITVLGLMGSYQGRHSRRMELTFYIPTMAELLSALRYAHEIMSKTGWTGADYVDDWKDCVDFSGRQVTLMKEWFYHNLEPKKGKALPIATCAMRLKNRGWHAPVECLSQEGRVYFEVYVGHGEPLDISKAEEKTKQWSNF